MILPSLGLLVLTGIAYGANNTDRPWDGLRVRWGSDFSSPDNFVGMPRTGLEALTQGYKMISYCEDDAKFKGYGVVKDADDSLVLLYDLNGYIAGIQTRIPSGLDHGYPLPSLQPPFIKKGDYYVLTAYFVDPAIICSPGRSQVDFNRDGTGTNLYIQNGTNPETDVIKIPREQSGLADTLWTTEKCWPTMGQHHWYNMSKDLSCDQVFPVFLLYNGGKLTGFGWGFATFVDDKRLEHPPKQVLNLFINDLPTCLATRTITTMHVFLTDKVTDNLC